MNPIIFGPDTILEGEEENFGGSAQGVQTIQHYTFTSRAAALAAKAQLPESGTRYSYNKKFPDQLTVYRDDTITGDGGISQDVAIVETWDLDWQEERVELMYATFFTKDSGGKVPHEVRLAAKKFSNTDPYDTDDLTTFDFGSELANKYRDKRLAGIDQYPLYRPILRQRILQATAGNVRASNAGINMVWEINPKSKLNALDDLSVWQWRKLPATKQAVKGKVEICQQYEGADEWDADLYPPYSGNS